MIDFRAKFARQHLDYLTARVQTLNDWERAFVATMGHIRDLGTLSVPQYNKLKQIYDEHQKQTASGANHITFAQRQGSFA